MMTPILCGALLIFTRIRVAEASAPRIQPFTVPEKLTVNDSLSLFCAVTSGAKPVTFSWRKNGRFYTGESVTQSNDRMSVLEISPVTIDSNGNYSCVVQNSFGKDEYTTAVDVKVAPFWTASDLPTELSVNASSSSRWKEICPAHGNPAPRLSLLKCGNDRISVLSDVNVNCKSTKVVDHDGKYACVAANELGVIFHTFTMKTRVPAKFEEKHSVVTARKGENVKLTCEAQGDTPLHIKWSKGNRIINKKPNDRNEIYETYQDQSMKSELFISNTDRNDGAIYTCLAENEHGHDERTVKLLIIEVPQPPRDIKISETWSRSASISWTPPYSGNSPITKYTVQYWRVATSHRLEEMEVAGTQSSVLLQDLKPGIAYQVSIVADNAVGSSQPSSAMSFTTGEEEPSAAPTDFHVEPKGPHTIRVSWKPPPRDEWNGELRGYYIGYKPTGHGPYSFKTADYKENSTNEFFLTGLQKGTDYSVVAKAFNGAGVGTQTHDLHVKTLDGDIPPPPRVFVGATGTSSITVQWVQQYQSNIRSYIVYYRPDSDLNLGWRETQLDNRASQFTLQQLISGTLYQIYVSATNDFGIGDPSEIISIRTQKSFSSDVSKILSNAIFGDANSPAYLNMFVLIPVLASLVTIVVVIIVTWVCLHRIKARHARSVLAGQAIPMDPKTYMTIARSRMASMDGNCDPPSKLFLVPMGSTHSSSSSAGSSAPSPFWGPLSMKAPLLPKARGPLPPTPDDIPSMNVHQVQTVVRTMPLGCAAQTLDGKQLVGPQQSPKQIPQPEYGQRYVDIQQPPPLPPDHPVGPPQALIQTDDIEAVKRQNVNEEMKAFLMNHNGLPGLQMQQAQQV